MRTSVDLRDPFLAVSVAKPGDRLPDDGAAMEQFALVLDTRESDVVAITGSVRRLRALLVHLSQLLDGAEQADLLTKELAGVSGSSVESARASIESVQAAYSNVPEELGRPRWSHQLDRRQMEEYRDQLLEAAAGVSVFGALLWSASPAPIWDTAGMEADFEVIAYRAAMPDVVVRRRSDGQHGTLQFTNRPRFFYGWEPTMVTITPVAG